MLKKQFALFLTCLLVLVSFTANAQSTKQLFHNPHDPVAGNPKGKITVVEFFDYQCSHCINMASIISNIIKTNPNVRVVFKEFPIRGPMSVFAARAALAANKQHKYYSLHHGLITARQPLSEDVVFAIARTNHINVKKLKKAMKSKSITKQLKANQKLAQKLQLPGTPAFFIGKTNAKDSTEVVYITGSISQSEFQNIINRVKNK